MLNNITFCLLSHNGAQLKQVTVSRRALATICFFSSICLILLTVVVINYFRLKGSVSSTRLLGKKIASQQEEIALQQNQILKFAEEINVFKSKLVDLNSFEQKIRIIANIEKDHDKVNIFGIGGSVPEDLELQGAVAVGQKSLLREMHLQVDDLSLASEKQKDGFETLLKYLKEQKNLLASTPAVSPVKGWVTSGFGYRTSPFTGRRELHRGLDISASRGTPIIATADGVISYAGQKRLMGNMITIDHGHGMITRYGHMFKTLKESGEKIKRGEIIGLVGSTGRTTGPHVHYEVRISGIPVDPEKYILD